MLELQHHGSVAIKHDVCRMRVGAEARRFAEAFARTLEEPGRRFGLVTVQRERARAGKPFVLGERFQGRFEVPHALRQQLDRRRPLGRAVDALMQTLESSPLRPALRRLEDLLTSDFGEIVELELESPPYVVKYVYLEGSYIAGSSTYIVNEIDERCCEVEQIFQYQELRLPYVLWMNTSVLRMHLAVVLEQISQAAELIGAPVLDCNIPQPYLKSLRLPLSAQALNINGVGAAAAGA